MKHGPKVIIVEADELLNEPRTVAEFDLRWVGVDELQRVTSRQFVSVEKGGAVSNLISPKEYSPTRLEGRRFHHKMSKEALISTSTSHLELITRV